MWFNLFLMATMHLNLAIAHDRVPRQAECVNPDSKAGDCVNLRSCDELNNLFKSHARNSSVKSFLRKSLCAPYARGQSPKVCCPKAARSVPECRRYTYTSKIVGGREAQPGEFPWMAALRYRIKNEDEYKFQCAGALISDQWVLTAAHCVKYLPSDLELISVRLGDLDREQNEQDDATEIDVPILEIVPHSEFSRNPIKNDIALLRLSTPVNFTKYIRPVCVLKGAEYKGDRFYERKKPSIMGWGITHLSGQKPLPLAEERINMVNNTKCAKDYQQQPLCLIDEKVLCAADARDESCQGDSGGPLIFPIANKRTYFVGGISSYSIGCVHDKYPGVYTRVAAFTDWIEQVTKLTF